jgi:hypothetical protein
MLLEGVLSNESNTLTPGAVKDTHVLTYFFHSVIPMIRRREKT